MCTQPLKNGSPIGKQLESGFSKLQDRTDYFYLKPLICVTTAIVEFVLTLTSQCFDISFELSYLEHKCGLNSIANFQKVKHEVP